MLTIKAPISLNCTKQVLTAGEDFSQKILGNYELFSTDIDSEDFIHLLSQPAEVYLAEQEGGVSLFSNTNIETKNIQKATIINNMFNRLLLTEQVDLTYQDRVYITDVLHKLGIHNTIGFMNEVNRIRLEQNNITDRLSAYWENSEYLAELVEEFTETDNSRQEYSQTSAIDNSSYLHQDIFERLKTAALYQIVNNFTAREKGVDRISTSELQLSQQKFFAEKMLVTSIENMVREEKVPLVFHTDNIYEEEAALPGMDENEVRQNITNALLFSTIRSILESRREERNIYNKSWYQVVENLYSSAENSLQRIQLTIRQNLERIEYNRSYENAVLYERMQQLVNKKSGDNISENVEYRTSENVEGDRTLVQQDLYHAQYSEEEIINAPVDISERDTYSETVLNENRITEVTSVGRDEEQEAPRPSERIPENADTVIFDNRTGDTYETTEGEKQAPDVNIQSEMYHIQYDTEEDNSQSRTDISETSIYPEGPVTEKVIEGRSAPERPGEEREAALYERVISQTEQILNREENNLFDNSVVSNRSDSDITLQSEMYHTRYDTEEDNRSFEGDINQTDIHTASTVNENTIVSREDASGSEEELLQRAAEQTNIIQQDNTSRITQRLAINEETIEELNAQANLYQTEVTDRSDNSVNTELTHSDLYNVSQEALTDITQEITQENSEEIKRFLTRQEDNRRTENETYLNRQTQKFESQELHNLRLEGDISQTDIHTATTVNENTIVSGAELSDIEEKAAERVYKNVLEQTNRIIQDNGLNISESFAINNETIEELTAQSRMYHTDITPEAGEAGEKTLSQADIYNITEESLTNISEEVTEENTREIKKFLTRQADNNLTENQIYLNKLTQQFEAQKPQRSKQDLIEAQRKALESPEEYMKEFREENLREQERRAEFEAKKRMLTPQENLNIYEIIENYLENPDSVPDGVTISRNNIGSLLQDSQQVEKSVEQQEKIIRELKEQTPQKAVEAIEAKMSHPAYQPTSDIYTNREVSHANIFHKQQESQLDEEFLQELLSRNRTTNERQVVDNTTINTTNVIEETQINELVSKQLQEQNRRIEDMIEGGMNKRVGTISDAVYRQIEKRLTNERRRRGI